MEHEREQTAWERAKRPGVEGADAFEGLSVHQQRNWVPIRVQGAPVRVTFGEAVLRRVREKTRQRASYAWLRAIVAVLAVFVLMMAPIAAMVIFPKACRLLFGLTRLDEARIEPGIHHVRRPQVR